MANKLDKSNESNENKPDSPGQGIPEAGQGHEGQGANPHLTFPGQGSPGGGQGHEGQGANPHVDGGVLIIGSRDQGDPASYVSFDL